MQHDVQTPIHPRGGPPPLGFASLRGGFAALPRWLRFAPVAVAAATPRSRALPAARLDAWAAALHLGSDS